MTSPPVPRRRRCLLAILAAAGVAVASRSGTAADRSAPGGPAGGQGITGLVIEPPHTTLVGHRDAAQLIVTGRSADGAAHDLTRAVTWSIGSNGVAAVDAGGHVRPVRDGDGEVIARLGSLEARATVRVRDLRTPPPVGFEREVLPALSKAGCNQGACHGTPSGRNGFRLSLRGYDPALDFNTLTREAGARRTDRMNPDASLILLKGTGTVAHQGGRRFTPESLPYRIVRDWVAEGLRPEPDGAPAVVRLDVVPEARVLDAPDHQQQLAVLARYSDGSVRDVTRLARYASSDETLATADDAGLVSKHARRGEVTVLAHLGSHVATSRLVFLEPVPGFKWSDPPETNFIDRHVFAKLKLLRILPSGLSDDATFVRRVYLDAIGLPPTADEVRAFLADPRPDKRSRLIDALLDRPEYAEFWALKWSDRLGCNQRFVGLKGAYSYHRWVRDQIAAGVPFDRMVRAIVTAKGSNYTNPPSSFYRRLRSPEEAAESVSQLFLGVRLQCARCHNHVAERWTQDDYYGFAAFFSQVRFKNGPQVFAQYNKEETVYTVPAAEVVHPRRGVAMPPKALLAPVEAVRPGSDRREALADWLVSPGNPFFARAAVNRIWYHLFGRGIVDPVDDLRDSNPPASAELLQALADDFVAHRFDTRHTVRTILNSRTYQLASEANPFNAEDTRYFSHANVRLLPAEPLLDAVCQLTGVPETLFHLPPGTRAAQVPDGEFVHPFLRVFGQPPRAVACECERGSESTLEQALQLVGGRLVHDKIRAPNNRIGKLLDAGADDTGLIDDLFLSALGRLPDRSERSLALEAFSRHPTNRRQAAEDLLWALINHPEFLFQH